MANKNYIIIKSTQTSPEFKTNLIRKIRNIISVYNIVFVEHPSFENLEIIQPVGLVNKQLSMLEI